MTESTRIIYERLVAMIEREFKIDNICETSRLIDMGFYAHLHFQDLSSAIKREFSIYFGIHDAQIMVKSIASWIRSELEKRHADFMSKNHI